MRVQSQVHLNGDDNTIPLIIGLVAADKEGQYSNTAAGPDAVVEQPIIEPQTYYVSVSHPSLRWTAEVLAWIDRCGQDD